MIMEGYALRQKGLPLGSLGMWELLPYPSAHVAPKNN